MRLASVRHACGVSIYSEDIKTCVCVKQARTHTAASSGAKNTHIHPNTHRDGNHKSACVCDRQVCVLICSESFNTTKEGIQFSPRVGREGIYVCGGDGAICTEVTLSTDPIFDL